LEAEALGQQLRDRGLQVHVVALSSSTDGPTTGAQLLGRQWSNPRTLWALRRVARNADLVIAYGSTALPACATALCLHRTPFVYRSIGDPKAWVRGSIHRWRTGLQMRQAAAVVPLYDDAATAIQSMYGVGAAQLSVIPNARSEVDFKRFAPEERKASRAALGLGAQSSVVAVIGALSQEKRVDLAIDAVSELADVHLVIAGDGPERAALEQRALRLLPGRHSFVGVVSDVRSVLAASDAVLLTSRTEGLPGVLIEAGLCGVPVVATACGGVTSLFDQGLKGESVRVTASPAEIAEATRRVLASDDYVPATHADWTWPTVIGRWLSLLRKFGITETAVSRDRVHPQVSVLIPVFNGGSHVVRAVESILAQTFRDFEIVVVDDGSSDNTAQQLIRFESDARVHVVRHPTNQGLVAALATGLAAARGPLVARLDSDDIAHPDRLQRQVDQFAKNPRLVLSATAYERVRPDGETVRLGMPPLHHGQLAVAMMTRNRLSHPTVMFDRAAVVAVGGYDPDWFPVEDYDLWLRLLDVGEYQGLASVEATYLENPDGISATRAQKQDSMLARRAAIHIDSQSPGAAQPTGDLGHVRRIARSTASLRRQMKRRGLPTTGMRHQALVNVNWVLRDLSPYRRRLLALIGAPMLAIRGRFETD